MKKTLFVIITFYFYFSTQAQPAISNDGHPEHVIIGAIVGGSVSYLVYRKTGNKLKSFLIGAATATALGYAKEALDPSFGRVKSDKDFGYSALGGVIGAGIVFPLKKRQPKPKPNIAASFENSLTLEEFPVITMD